MEKDPMRKDYNILSDKQKTKMADIKKTGAVLHNMILEFNDFDADPRCMSIARTKAEEAVMWAVKGVTVTG